MPVFLTGHRRGLKNEAIACGQVLYVFCISIYRSKLTFVCVGFGPNCGTLASNAAEQLLKANLL